MTYAMSDIHGYLSVLEENMKKVDLSGDNRIVFCGDYIDYGPDSGGVLRYIYDLQQKHGAEKIIVLKGNHECDLLDWLDTYSGPGAGEPDEDGIIAWNGWLEVDADGGYNTLRTLVTPEQWAFFQQVAPTLSEDSINMEAARMVLSASGDLICWLRELPYYYQTEKQIFVHAGIDEEAGGWWEWGTSESTFVGKYPVTIGPFYKDIVSGHVSAAKIAGDPAFTGRLWHDGASHWFLDGTVRKTGRIPLLAYDEATEEYREL